MLDLDKRVSTDTILLSNPKAQMQMDGFFSDLNKKRKNLESKLGPLSPSNIAKVTSGPLYKALKSFESKNREGLKKAGAVVAAAVAIYFTGPAALAYLQSIGGSAIAQQAASKVAQAAIANAIKKKLTPKKQAALARASQEMTPAQFAADPEIAKLSQELAAALAEPPAIVKTLPPQQAQAIRMTTKALAVEGAMVVQDASKEVATPRLPTWVKVGMPLIGLLTFVM